jgi:hypothetical protein
LSPIEWRMRQGRFRWLQRSPVASDGLHFKLTICREQPSGPRLFGAGHADRRARSISRVWGNVSGCRSANSSQRRAPNARIQRIPRVSSPPRDRWQPRLGPGKSPPVQQRGPATRDSVLPLKGSLENRCHFAYRCSLRNRLSTSKPLVCSTVHPVQALEVGWSMGCTGCTGHSGDESP